MRITINTNFDIIFAESLETKLFSCSNSVV